MKTTQHKQVFTELTSTEIVFNGMRYVVFNSISMFGNLIHYFNSFKVIF
jgi:predicted aspartyl protease